MAHEDPGYTPALLEASSILLWLMGQFQQVDKVFLFRLIMTHTAQNSASSNPHDATPSTSPSPKLSPDSMPLPRYF